jgi:hypothetical protein
MNWGASAAEGGYSHNSALTSETWLIKAGESPEHSSAKQMVED